MARYYSYSILICTGYEALPRYSKSSTSFRYYSVDLDNSGYNSTSRHSIQCNKTIIHTKMLSPLMSTFFDFFLLVFSLIIGSKILSEFDFGAYFKKQKNDLNTSKKLGLLIIFLALIFVIYLLKNYLML